MRARCNKLRVKFYVQERLRSISMRSFVSIFTAIIVLLLNGRLTDTQLENETLYVLSQFPYAVRNFAGQLPTWREGANIIPALNIAVKQINSQEDLLPNHNIELVQINGGCDFIDVTVANFTEAVTRLARKPGGKRFVGLIGPGCSRSTYGVAPLINRHDLNMVSLHGAGASVFENRTKYPYLFGALGSVEGFGELAVALMRKTKWRKIAILFHDTRLYYATMKKEIVSAVTQHIPDAQIVYSSMVRLNNFLPLDDLLHSRARIIFVVTPPEHSLQIMCLAFHMGMIYPAYQWVIASRTLDDFNSTVSFTYNEKDYQCSHDNFKAALNNNLFMNYRLTPLFDNATKTVANTTYDEYCELYEEEVEEYNSNESNPFRNISTSVWAGYFYDSFWALAIALHNVTQKYNVSLSDYQYKDENITKLIAEELYNVNFNGSSGVFKFSQSNGFVHRPIELTQIIDYKEAYKSSDIESDNESIVLISDEFEEQNSLAHVSLAVLFGIIAFLQLLVVIALHILTIVHKHHSSVKATSPSLTHIAYVGIYLLAMVLLITCINEHPSFSREVRAAFCQTKWSWFLPVSITLSLGPVVVRTWRLYRIFTHYLNPGPFISNPVLITAICIMVTIDLIIAIVWTSIDPFRLEELEFTEREENATFLTIREGCRCDHFFAWFGAMFTYKVALLIVMFALAFLTRKIKNRSFVTTSLNVFGYLIVFIFALGFSAYFIIAFVWLDPNLELVVFSVTLNLILISNIVCILFPPLLQPLRETGFSKYNIGKVQLKSLLESTVSKQRKISSQSQTSQTYFIS